MSGFDFKAYYQEFDARMAAPDEPIDEFLKRRSEYRQSFTNDPSLTETRRLQGWSFESSFANANHEPIGAINDSRVPSQKLSTVDPAFSSPEPRELVTRKSPELSLFVRPSQDVADQSISAQSPAPENRLGETVPPEGTGSIGQSHHEYTDARVSPERTSSPSRDEIESFTLGVIDTPSTKKQDKRKSPDDDEGEVVHPKKRHAKGTRSPQNPGPTDISANRSPISSFSDVKVKRGQKEDLLLVTKEPQLQFEPLNEAKLTRPPTKNKGKTAAQKSMNSKKDEFEPPTSPIEDPSLILPEGPPKKKAKVLAVTAHPSELQLELQNCIAKHTSTKPRDKVMKLEKKASSSKAIKPNPSSVTINESDIIHISSSPSSRASSPERAKPSTSKRVIKPDKPPLKVKGKGKAKEKPQPMTPAEFARSLMETTPMSEGPSSTSQGKLRGKRIFYAGGDMNLASQETRKKMQLIVSNGGSLLAEFDAINTTHVVTDTGLGNTLRAMGLKRISQIPHHIPTVKWGWVAAIISQGPGLKEDQDQRNQKHANLSAYHAAFTSRADAGHQTKVITSMATLQARKQAKIQNAASRSTSNEENIPGPSNQPGPSTSPENVESSRPFGPLLSPPTSPANLPSKAVATSSSAISDAQLGEDSRSEGSSKDPLAEFDSVVREKLERRKHGLSPSSDESESDMESERGAPRASRSFVKQGWTCDNKEPTHKKDCPNQDVIDKLTELMKLHQAKFSDDDRWRVYSYRKAIGALRSYPTRIRSLSEAKGIHGVGEKTALKIMEIIHTGELVRIKYEKTPEVEATTLFCGIFDVGGRTAMMWYAAGCRTLDDLRAGKGGVQLSRAQKIGLQFYHDINDRMPREEAKAIFDLIKPIALQLDSKLFIEIMGSYRRGSPDCGDIDILITRPTDDGLTHTGVVPKLLRDLHTAGIITEDLSLPTKPHDLECTYRGLCRLPHVPGSKRRRIDILSVPWKNRGGALLYYTGNDFFNRSMRLKARKMQYSLNQRGLYKVDRDNKGKKMGEGVLVASETEEEIFKILGVPWQTPPERVRY